MNPALWFLLSRSLVNNIRRRIGRLRQPKYLLGALLGGAYFYFYFYRFLFLGDFQGRARNAAPLDLGLSPDLYLDLAALLLLGGLILFAWLWPSSRAALAFSEAEISFLFPAPLSRRQLLVFKLLRSQLGLLLLALLTALVTGRFARDGHALQHTIGWWVVFATLQLHRLGASFVLTRLMDRGLSTLWRRAGILLGLGAAVGLLAYWRQHAPDAPDLQAMLREGELGTYVRQLATVGPAPWLLWPFQKVVAPWFAADPMAFFMALGPALAIVAAHFVWVVRSEVAFEEASLALSAKYAQLIAARRAGNFRPFGPKKKAEPIFSLRPTGWAVPALVWKSWIYSGGRKALWFGLVGAAIAIAVACVPWLFGQWKIVSKMSVILGASLSAGLLFGSTQATAQAIRRELEMADLFKTAPVPAWQVVLGQMLGPALRWSALQWVAAVLLLVGLLAQERGAQLLSEFGPPVVLGLVVSLPPLNVLASLIPATAMVVFPGWFKPGEGRGVEATGLGLLLLVAQIVFLCFALILPGVAAAGVGFATQLFWPLPGAVFAGLAAGSLVMALEAWIGALLLGKGYEAYDVSAER